jgi:hypothetical protein
MGEVGDGPESPSNSMRVTVGAGNLFVAEGR